jgi:glyoxylase-like metal-dependent hydrolase (beta-lactamase superfamily II)
VDRPIPALRVLRLPVGPIQANCYIVHDEASGAAVIVDPGDDPGRVLSELSARSLVPLGVLVTHGHFDHVGGVARVARELGVDVYMSRIDAPLLERPDLPPARGPIEPYAPDRLLDGGERLELGPFAFDVLAVPGHARGHVAFAGHGLLLSGDVLFAGSVGRTDIDGADWPTLAASLQLLLETLPGDTVVLPGHGPETTLAREAATNPFLTGAATP